MCVKSHRHTEMDVPRTQRLIALFHRRWAVPALAELDRGKGAKFVTLERRLDASPTALRQTLDDLIEQGWVMKNPGYGHPLRPEYILTGRGQAIAPACGALDDCVARIGLGALAFRKWSMPILDTLRQGQSRFTELSASLVGITDRALATGLKNLASEDLVIRDIRSKYPPTPFYHPGDRATQILPILEEM